MDLWCNRFQSILVMWVYSATAGIAFSERFPTTVYSFLFITFPCKQHPTLVIHLCSRIWKKHGGRGDEVWHINPKHNPPATSLKQQSLSPEVAKPRTQSISPNTLNLHFLKCGCLWTSKVGESFFIQPGFHLLSPSSLPVYPLISIVPLSFLKL